MAESVGELVGFISGKVQEEPYQKIDKAGSVETFVVRKAYRGRGIGKDLMSALMDWFRQQGCTGAGVGTWYTNREAIEACKHMGFQEFCVGLVQHID